MFKASKIILFGCLLLIGFSVVAPVVSAAVPVLEQRYPSLPVIGSLDDAKDVLPEERMSFYVKYFINVVFFITISVSVIVLIIAGVAYVGPPILGKMIPITTAKTMIKNAFLGLFILSISYTVLYAINPQLLLFKTVVTLPPLPVDVLATERGPNTVVLVRAPFASYMRRTLAGMSREIREDINGNYVDDEGYLTDGYGNYVDISGAFLDIGDTPVDAGGITFLQRMFKRATAITADARVKGIEPYKVTHFQAEIPFLQTAKILGQGVDIINGDGPDTDNPGLKALLDKCKCGESKSYVNWGASVGRTETTIGGKCTGGMNPKDKDSFKDTLKANPLVLKSQYNCLTQCGDCGAGGALAPPRQLDCDLREVTITTTTISVVGEDDRVARVARVKTEEGNEDSWKAFNWYAVDGNSIVATWSPGNEISNEAERIRLANHLIKYKRLQLLEIKARLEGQKGKSFPETVAFLADALTTNKLDYVIANAKDGIFGFDAAELVEVIESSPGQYNVVVQDLGESDENPEDIVVDIKEVQSFSKRILSMLAPFVTAATDQQLVTGYFEPGDFFYIIQAPVAIQAKRITDFNQEVDRNAKRINLFSVLTGLSLEKIEGIYQGCLTDAFGVADYKIKQEKLKGILEGSIAEGAAERFSAELDNMATRMTAGMSAGVRKAVDDDVADKFIEKHLIICQGNGSCTGNMGVLWGDMDEDIKNELRESMGEEGECGGNSCCQCIDAGIKQGISPSFVSRTITKVFTSDIENISSSLKEFLDKDMRSVLFEKGGKIDKFLDRDMKSLYDAVFNGALTKSFAEMIPGLDTVLEIPVTKILPKYVSQQLGNLNKFLMCTINGCCRITNDEGVKIETKDDCIGKEEFDVRQTPKGPQNRCCIIGAKQSIQRHSEDYVNKQMERYVKQPISSFVQGKVSQWGLSADYISVADCYKEEWPRRIFNFEGENLESQTCKEYAGPGFIEIDEIKGKCVKITPEIVKNIESIQIPIGVEWDDPETKKIVKKTTCETVNASLKKSICRSAGYKWFCGFGYKIKPRTGEESEDDIEETGEFWNMDDTIFVKGFDKDVDCECGKELFAAVGRVTSALGTEEGLAKVGRRALGFAINFGEQFALALIDITVQTAIEYAKVFIEDNIIAPFASAFSNVTDFQRGLDAFLKKSVAEVLPDKVAETLQSNIDAEIAKICLAYQGGAPKNYIGIDEDGNTVEVELDVNGNPIAEEGVEIVYDSEIGVKFNLPARITWDGEHVLSTGIIIKKETGDRFCRLAKHLDTTVLGELESIEAIGQDLTNLLTRTVKNHIESGCRKLDKDNCLEWLNKSIAEILWPGIVGIKELIEGTPRQFICGERAEWNNTEDRMTIKFNGDSVYTTCQGIKKARWGILPSTDPDIVKNMSNNAKKLLVPWCNFIYVACDNPFVSAVAMAQSMLQKPLGEAIETLTIVACNKNQTERVEHGCGDGACWAFGAPDLTMLQQDENNTDLDCGVYKAGCKACSFATKDKISYSLVEQSIKIAFWLPAYTNPITCPTCAYHIYPPANSITPGSPLANEKAKERQAYKWFYYYFASSKLPPSVSFATRVNFETELKAVANKRGFSDIEWSILKNEVEQGITNGIASNFPDGVAGGILVDLVAWRATGAPTIKTIFTKIPLRIIKSITPNEPALLLPLGSNEPTNFLAKTPYTLLNTYFCDGAIEPIFAKKYPNYTVEALWANFRRILANAIPYSIESTDVVTISEIFKAIATIKTTNVVPAVDAILTEDNDLREAYLFCKAMEYRPAELLGLDQRLISYIRPEEAKILFDLIENEMYSYERPDGLNTLLDYLYRKTPTNILTEVQRSLPSAGSSVEMYSYLFETNIANFDGIVGQGHKRFFDADGYSILREEFMAHNQWAPPADSFIEIPGSVSEIIIGEGEGAPTTGIVLGILAHRYYLVHGTVGKIAIYHNPSGLANTIGDVITFLNTKIGAQLNRDPLNKPIIDIICEHDDMKITVGNTPNEQEISLCDWKYEDDQTTKLLTFLNQTPMAMLKEYLKDPLWKDFPGMKNTSIMDILSENSVLGERYLDTLGRVTPLGSWTMWGADAQDKVDGWVKTGIDHGVGAIQGSLEKALVEWPKQAAKVIAKKLGFAMGEEASKVIVGKCYIPEAGVECAIGEIEKNGTKRECCILAKGSVCKPRCQLCGPEKDTPCEEADCDQILGESLQNVPNPGGVGTRSMCCYSVVNKRIAGVNNNYCVKQRSVHPELSQCRTTEDPRTTEERGEVTTDTGRTYAVCTRVEDLVQTSDPGNEDLCCSTVAECVMSKLAAHLEVMAEMLANDKIPVSCLTKKCKIPIE